MPDNPGFYSENGRETQVPGNTEKAAKTPEEEAKDGRRGEILKERGSA